MDLYPTILDDRWRRGRPGAQRRGRRPQPRAAPEGRRRRPGRDALYWHFPHYYATTTPVGAVRQGNLKLLEYFEDDRVELYDLAADLSEEHDLAESRPEDASRLRGLLHDWRQQIDAQMPTRNPDRNP